MSLSRSHIARPAYQGNASSFLFQHRAFIHLRLTWGKLFWNGLLVVLLTAGWYYALRFIGVFWGYVLALWNTMLELPGQVVMVHYATGSPLHFAVPHLALPSGPPSETLLLATGFGVLLFWIISHFLPKSLVPVIYFIRAFALLLATSVAYFYFTPDTFPYTLEDYVRGMVITTTLLTLLVPIVLGITFFLLDVRWHQKLGLTLATLGLFAFLIPHQYLIHAIVLHHGSLLYMAPIYLLFGLPLDVLVFVALYAWGMSWKGTLLHENGELAGE